LILLLLEERITPDLIKIFLGKGFRTNFYNSIKRMEKYKSQIIFQRKILEIYDLFFQLPLNILKKKSFLNNSVLYMSLNFAEDIDKFPSLRVIISKKDDTIKKKFKSSLNNVTSYLLENPLLCSKIIIQEIIWAYFRLETNMKPNLKFLAEIRSFSFFNNSKTSLSLFYYILESFEEKIVQSCINICFKNFQFFITNKFGCLLMILIVNNFYLKGKSWLNSLFLKTFFKLEPFSCYFNEIFFKFFFRKTTRCIKSINKNIFLYKIKKSEYPRNLIETLISRKKKRILYFLIFIKYKVFKIFPRIYPSFFQDEFIQMLKTKERDQGFKSLNDKKIYPSNIFSDFKIRKSVLFLYVRKIKKFFPKFKFIFFLVRIILRFISENIILRKSFTNNFSDLISQIHSHHTIFNENFNYIPNIPVVFPSFKILEYYRFHKNLETC